MIVRRRAIIAVAVLFGERESAEQVNCIVSSVPSALNGLSKAPNRLAST